VAVKMTDLWNVSRMSLSYPAGLQKHFR